MFKCENCAKEFKGKSGKSNRFCSTTCYHKWRKGKPAPNMEGLKLGRGWNKGQSAEWAKGENNVNWAGGKVTLVCQECGKEYDAWPYLKDESKYCSTECSDKHTLALGRGWNKGISTPSNGVLEKHIKENGAWNKGKECPWMRGELHPNWNGGSSLDNNRNYNGPEYKDWRKAVFERDNYTCQVCGVRGGKLEAHHVKSWARHEDLRFDVSNGMTVHIKCHGQIDKFRAARLKK